MHENLPFKLIIRPKERPLLNPRLGSHLIRQLLVLIAGHVPCLLPSEYQRCLLPVQVDDPPFFAPFAAPMRRLGVRTVERHTAVGFRFVRLLFGEEDKGLRLGFLKLKS